MGTIDIGSKGRFMLVEVKINSKTFVMGSVYAPTIDEPKFFDSLFFAIADLTDNDSVMGWDWSLVLNNRLDKDGGPPHSNRNSKERLKSYMNIFNLNDIFRDFFPSKKVHLVYQIFSSNAATEQRLSTF